MSRQTSMKDGLWSVASWALWITGGIVMIYFLGFAVLVMFPKTSGTLQALGVSSESLETLYRPVIRWVE